MDEHRDLSLFLNLLPLLLFHDHNRITASVLSGQEKFHPLGGVRDVIFNCHHPGVIRYGRVIQHPVHMQHRVVPGPSFPIIRSPHFLREGVQDFRHQHVLVHMMQNIFLAGFVDDHTFLSNTVRISLIS